LQQLDSAYLSPVSITSPPVAPVPDLNSLLLKLINVMASMPRTPKPTSAQIAPASASPQSLLLKQHTAPAIAAILTIPPPIRIPFTTSPPGISCPGDAPNIQKSWKTPIRSTDNTTKAIQMIAAIMQSMPAAVGFQVLCISYRTLRRPV
jgi:hypothetical protein